MSCPICGARNLSDRVCEGCHDDQVVEDIRGKVAAGTLSKFSDCVYQPTPWRQRGAGGPRAVAGDAKLEARRQQKREWYKRHREEHNARCLANQRRKRMESGI